MTIEIELERPQEGCVFIYETDDGEYTRSVGLLCAMRVLKRGDKYELWSLTFKMDKVIVKKTKTYKSLESALEGIERMVFAYSV